MEDIDGGLHPAVDGKSLDEDEDEDEGWVVAVPGMLTTRHAHLTQKSIT